MFWHYFRNLQHDKCYVYNNTFFSINFKIRMKWFIIKFKEMFII